MQPAFERTRGAKPLVGHWELELFGFKKVSKGNKQIQILHKNLNENVVKYTKEIKHIL